VNRRQFLYTTALASATSALTPAHVTRAEASSKHFILSETGSGRATAYSETNKIITFKGKTHASWLDVNKDGFQVRIRTLDRSNGTWSDTYTIGEAQDNHGGPALTVDSKGYLHVVYYAHNGPMRYRRSVNPNDASVWTDYTEVEGQLSYPTLVCGADDTLHLTCRSYAKTEPWTCRIFTKPADGPWSAGRELLRATEPGYAQFMDALAWGADHRTLHFTCWFYGGDPGIGKTIGYLRSPDAGQTWTRLDGTAVVLPATADTVDVVARMPEGNQQGLRGSRFAVSPDGRPHVLWSDYNPAPQQGWMSFPDSSGNWKAVCLNPFLPDAFADWGLLTPGGITFNERGGLYIALTLVKPKTPADPSTALHPAQDIALFRSGDLGKTFACEILPADENTQNRWLPNLEAPTGHNPIQGPPGLIYTEGDRGESLDDVVANTVHWQSLT